MADITQMAARSGKVIRSDNTIVNEADGINDDGSRRVQLTGSKALQTKEITIFDQLAITDTNPHYYGGGSFLAIPNFNDYNERILMVRNSHDQPVKIDIVSNMRLVDTLVYGVSQKNQSITIPANGAFKPTLITSDDLESLGKIFSYDVSIRITATALPTTGSITIKLKMVSK